MKEVLAVIRMDKINPTKAALAEAGFPALTAAKVMGRGSRPVDYELRRALLDDAAPQPEVVATLAQGPRLVAKRLLSLVVPDEAVSSVVKTLIAANRTGNPGDGKIFVLPVHDAARVRTAEIGAAAIDEMASC
ncbi:MAG: P-II family nitrogen regulator [Deltaproteobacteria bacterium]|nr:P-II family nitrogen regulator [Deltaproteobacteria bacterium]